MQCDASFVSAKVGLARTSLCQNLSVSFLGILANPPDSPEIL